MLSVFVFFFVKCLLVMNDDEKIKRNVMFIKLMLIWISFFLKKEK